MFVIWNNNEQWFQLGVLFLLFLLLVERATKFIHYFYIFIFIRIKLQLFSLVCGASKRTSESGIRLQVLFWLCKKYASMISNKHRCRYRKNTMTLSVSTTKIWKNKIRNKFSFLDGVHFFLLLIEFINAQARHTKYEMQKTIMKVYQTSKVCSFVSTTGLFLLSNTLFLRKKKWYL